MNQTANTQPQPDVLYARARQILQANPGMGKKKLAGLVGVKTPTSRRLIERYRGETQGHSQHPDYQRVLQLKTAHPDWGAVKVSQALGLTLDHAKLHLARWVGAQGYVPATPAPPSVAPAPEPAGNRDNELQVSEHDGRCDVSFRGTRIQTLEELLVYAQVDTKIWEIERHTLNKYEVAAKTPEGMSTTLLFQIKAWLRRKVAEEKLTGLMQQMLEQFKQAAPLWPAVQRHAPGSKGMLELSLMDMHLGKFASAMETGGRGYDADTAERMFTAALEDC